MTYEFTIQGRLPGINELISANRTNRYKGAKIKAESQQAVEYAIRTQIKDVRANEPVILSYIWYEKNTRRDLDNISGFGHKVIQDALVSCGILKNDGWKNIKGFNDAFAVDRDNPRIVVMIEETI